MRRWALAGALALAVPLLTACPGPTVPNPNPNDSTPPNLTFGTIGLQSEVSMTAGNTTASLRLRTTDSAQLVSQATDEDSGIEVVSITGHLDITCIPTSGTNKLVIANPINQSTSRSGPADFPSSLTAAVPLAATDLHTSCPAGTSFYELDGTLTAKAKNTAGLGRELGPLTVRSFGPDRVRASTFNLYRPGHHTDSVYQTWGAYLNGKADVLMLTEVEDRRRAELVAAAAGLPNVVVLRESDSDIALASRGPIRQVVRLTVIPPGSSLGSAHSNVLVAETDLAGYPHTVVVAHLGIRDANDVLFTAWMSAPGRLQAVQNLLAEVDHRSPRFPVIVGGDFNAYSGVGPQDVPGATTEMTAIRQRLLDPLTVLSVPDADLCGGRIDYILVQGYRPTTYRQDCTANEPSDHPMVISVLEAN